MGKSSKSQLGIFDYIGAFILIVCFGLGLEPVFLTLEELWLWGIFAVGVVLIVAGIALSRSKKYAHVALFAFIIGCAWFIQITLHLCTFVQIPVYA